MNLYRIGPKDFLDIYTGQGSSFQHGARWNSATKPVLYFASSPAVAMLEMGNYIPSPDLVPDSYRLAIYEISDNIEIEVLSEKSWPNNWNSHPYPESTQAVGDKWLASLRTAFLKVPSSAVASGLDSILVGNPLHKDINEIRLVDLKQEIYSERLFKNK